MTNFRVTIVILSALLFSAAFAHAGDNVRLRYNPCVGDSTRYEVQTSMEMSQEAMGQNAEFSTTTRAPMTAQCTAKNDSSFTLRVKYGAVELSMKTGGMLEGSKELQDTTMTVSAFSKIAYSVKASRRGTALAHTLENADDLASLKRMTGSIFGTNPLQLRLPQYPEQESVPLGHSWKHTQRDTTDFNGGTLVFASFMTTTLEATVDTLGKKCARLRTQTDKIEISGGIEAQGMNIQANGDGNSVEIAYVELASGLPMYSDTHSVMDLRMAVSGQESAIITMEVKMDSSTRRK